MKRTIITIIAAAVVAGATLAQTVNLGVDVSQPVSNLPLGVVYRYSLIPGQACTTKAWRTASLGGFSIQYACSLKQASDKDTAILYVRYQEANLDLACLWNATGMDSVIAAADTLINYTAKTGSRIIDHTQKPYRALLYRQIWLNTGPDTLRGLWLYPLWNVDL